MGATEEQKSGKNGSDKGRQSGKESSRSRGGSGGGSGGKAQGSGGSSDATAQAAETSGSSGKKARKPPQRKPLWVAIPATYEDVTDINETGDAETKSKPATYHFYKCEGKPDVRKALAKHNIDVSNIQDVVVLRANPIEFQAQTQVSLKF